MLRFVNSLTKRTSCCSDILLLWTNCVGKNVDNMVLTHEKSSQKYLDLMSCESGRNLCEP